MRRTIGHLLLGGAALALVSWLLPPNTLSLSVLGLAVMLLVVQRRRRHNALAPI